MPHRLLRRLAVAPLALVALVGVAACGDDSGGKSAVSSLEGTTWVLQPRSGNALPQGIEVTAKFSDGKISGVSGCNSYTGTYEAKGTDLKISGIATTSMACADDVMGAEKLYLSTLQQTASYEAGDGSLTLLGDKGATLLTFSAMTGAALQGSWNVTSFHSGNAIVSVANGTTITADITDKEISGNGGCNQYNATLTVDGQNVTVGPIAASKKVCGDEVDKQEQAYFAALAETTTWAAAGSSLDLLRSDGGYAVTMQKG